MLASSSSPGLCHAKLPGHFDSPVNAYSVPYRHDSVNAISNTSKRRSCICSCCLWLSAIITLFILLMTICFLALYFYIHPRFPEFHLDHMALSHLKLTNDSGDLLLNSQFNASVEATNRNMVLRFRYDDFNITVWASGTKHKDTLLGRGVAPGFEQGQRNVALIRSVISVQSEVVDASTAENIVEKMKGGELVIAVEVATGMKTSLGDWNVIEVPVHLLCEGVDAGSLKGGSNPSCQLDFFQMLLRQLHLLSDRERIPHLEPFFVHRSSFLVSVPNFVVSVVNNGTTEPTLSIVI